MSLNAAPSSERIHIGFFGRRNSGKSSIVNAVTGQELSVVSDVKGTTTDPVFKAMELPPAGPVVIIDTPGFDDDGTLGELRVRKTRQVLNRTDLAVLVVDSAVGITRHDEELIGLFKERGIDHLIVWNKTDLVGYREDAVSDTGTGQNGLEGKADRDQAKCREIHVSARTGRNIDELREMLTALAVR